VTPLQVYEAEIRFIVEWAYLVADGLDTYKRNQTSTRETS
jgi:hypothetical protein